MCSHNRPAAATASEYPVSNAGAGEKWIKSLTQNRLGTFLGGHFAGVNLSSVLFTHRLDGEEHVQLQVWSAPGRDKPGFEEAMKQEFKPAKKGDRFGPSCEWSRGTNHWWKVTVKVPKYWEQYERVQFEFDPGCEAMIFTTDGTPLQGITGGYGGDRRVEYILQPEDRAKGSYSFVIESSCNGMFGVPWNGDTIAPPDMNRYFTLDSADLVVPNQEAWGLLWDFQTLREIVDTIPGNTPLQNEALSTANAIMNAFRSGDSATISAARKVAEEVLGSAWAAQGADVYKHGAQTAKIWGIGHCHIDTAWLWPYSVTQQKVARSWATQVDLMERYPEHRFAASSAQQYKWLEQLYPKLFEKVKAKINDGRFHLVGGSWVENDSNMPSGEALVRQFLYGQRYFESRFGKRCETGWLPDSFGLTGAYPQIMRLSGMKYFFTQKLSWNNINVFPHSTFNWVGIDGTQVLCHMTPVDTYTAQATVGDVNKGLVNHKNLESSSTALLVFGNGDGGGGPLSKMLENLRRIRAVGNNHRELPPVSMGASVEDFFADIESHTNHGKTLPNWNGELYLEFHRGTYTSHASIKKGNRKSEILLRDVEHLATQAAFVANVRRLKYTYPKEKIDESWEKVLLNQFHDVLPGSAIGMVYDDAEKLYAEIRQDSKTMIKDAMKTIFSGWLAPENSTGSLLAYNTTFFPRREVMPIALDGSKDLVRQVAQVSADGRTGYALLDAPAGAGLARPIGMFADCMPVSVFTNGSDHLILCNSSVQLTISKGRITSLLDVPTQRELIPSGTTGGLVIFEDRPNYWDAWDVEIHHLEKKTELEFSSINVLTEGPLRSVVSAEVKYGKSKIRVNISLDAVGATVKSSSRSMVRFDAEVDWRERHEFLKFQIPLNIHNTHATYETQFGYVQRPTHKNTTWDIAQFEVCGHKFADLSEYGYGVALLSESKYGFSCIGNILSMSLLRAATAPDAEQDQGEHTFSWAVMPHLGSFHESDVPIAGHLFNSPLHFPGLVSQGAEAALESVLQPPVAGGAPNVIIETMKRGEDDDFSDTSRSTFVFRIYEAYGGHAHAKLPLGKKTPFVHIEKIAITNLLEDELEVLQADDAGTVTLDFHGFEVKTVKMTVKHIHKEQREKRESWVTVD